MSSEKSFEVLMTTLGGVNAALAFVIVFLAGLLVVAILTSQKLRQSLRHVTIASLTMADVFIGLIYCPIMFFSYALILSHDCSDAFSMHVLIHARIVSCWGLVLLHVYYMLAVLDVKPRGVFAENLTALRVLGSLLPWILSLLAIPIFLGPENAHACMLVTRLDEDVILLVTEVVPLGLVAVLSVVNMIIAHKYRHSMSKDSPSTQLVATPKDVESPCALVSVSIVTMVLLLPEYIFRKIPREHKFHAGSMIPQLTAMVFTVLLALAKSAVVPLVWMADKAVKDRMARTIRCHCCQDDDDVTDPAVTYKSLEEKHDVGMDDSVRP